MDKLFEIVHNKCKEAFKNKNQTTPKTMAKEMMHDSDLVMHHPYHHYLVPAILLTATAIKNNMEEKEYIAKLAKALDRASKVPGAYCGNYGACGAALGNGIYSSVMEDTTPHSKESLATAHKFTAYGLQKISEYSGPRCCKRCTFLALDAAEELMESEYAIDLISEKLICDFFADNDDCLGSECCYHPAYSDMK